MDKPIVLVFNHEKSTPGTHRFKEVEPEDGGRPVVGTIYVTKKAIGDKAPSRISVEIQSLD